MKKDVIVIPEGADFDVVVAVWMLVSFGKGEYDGFDYDRIEFLSFKEGGGEDREGVLRLGFESRVGATVTLSREVAVKLGLDLMSEFERILKFVDNLVFKEAGNPADMAGLYYSMDTDTLEDRLDAVHWVFHALDAMHAKEKKLADLAIAECDRVCEAFEVVGDNDFCLKIVLVRGDVCLSWNVVDQWNSGLDILVQVREDSIRIAGKRQRRIAMKDVVRILRLKELEEKAGRVINANWKKLEEEGVVKEAPEWSFVSETSVVSSGSIRSTDGLFTRLSEDVIMHAIMAGVEHSRFPDDLRRSKCESGVCSHRWEDDECPSHYLGLRQCRRVRFNSVPEK